MAVSRLSVLVSSTLCMCRCTSLPLSIAVPFPSNRGTIHYHVNYSPIMPPAKVPSSRQTLRVTIAFIYQARRCWLSMALATTTHTQRPVLLTHSVFARRWMSFIVTLFVQDSEKFVYDSKHIHRKLNSRKSILCLFTIIFIF